jgi:hypothetical protein
LFSNKHNDLNCPITERHDQLQPACAHDDFDPRPTVLIGLLLSIFFVVHRYNDLQRQLEDAGASIIEPLAVSSEYGMNLQNRESIGQLISVLHRRHSEIVRAISVYDEHNRLFVTSNFHLDPAELKIPDGTPFPRNLSVMRRGDIMILRTPIISESYSPDESAHPTPNPAIICWDMWRWSWISSRSGCSSTKRFLSPA